MSKISELSDGGSLLPTDFLIAVRSGGNVKVQADQTEFDRIRLGDNEKIELGNNQDLQIYHDGSNSYISDQGTNDLKVLATDFQLKNAADNEFMMTAVTDGAVTLYHNGSPRISTTSGGADVTGSVTANGASGGNLFLTSTDTSGATGEVLGDINFVSSDASGGSSGTMAKIISLFDSNGDNAAIKIQTGFSTGSGSPTLRDRALFASNGDISFFEDTGTTAKLEWKSSDERLDLTGAGGLTVDGAVVITGNITQGNGDLLYAGGGNWDIAHTIASQNLVLKTTPSGGSATQRIRVSHNGDVSMYEDTGVTPKLVWKSSDERLGLGTASPAQKLHIYDATAANQAVRLGNPASAGTYGEIQYDPGGFEHLYIKAKGTTTGYGNIVFQTGGTPTTALTLNAAGAATFTGAITANAGVVVDNITIDGQEIDVSSGDLTLDVAGNIVLNADSGGVYFNDGAAEIGLLANTGNNFVLMSRLEDKDIIFKGKDGSSTITALTLDMSEGGAATFSGSVTSAGLHSTTAGSSNFIAGANAGNSIVSGGSYNTVVGDDAGTAITEGDFNTALGYGALIADTKGARSVALGYRALASQNFTTATNNFNVAIGHNAGGAVLTGIRNTLLGGEAGDSITTGNYNICIGNADVSASDASGQLVVGQGVTGNANSSFCFGIDATDSAIAFGATTITAPSDERYKEEITDATAGLSFVNDLRPVTFKWKKAKDIPVTQKAYVEGSEDRVMNDYTNHGFIAQEVKTVIDAHPEIKDGFDMWMEDDADGRQRLGPAALIPVLVKAIQELTARIETLEG